MINVPQFQHVMDALSDLADPLTMKILVAFKTEFRNKGKRSTSELEDVVEEISVKAFEEQSITAQSFVQLIHTSVRAEESCLKIATNCMKRLEKYPKVLKKDTSKMTPKQLEQYKNPPTNVEELN